MRWTILSLLFSFLVLAGCTKEHPIDSILIKEKIVVNSLTQADSLFTFNISSSIFITDNQRPQQITGADVKLLDENNNLLEQVPETSPGVFVSSLRAIPQNSYYLTVDAPELDMVYSNIKTPSPTSVVSLDHKLTSFSLKKVQKVELQINDSPTEDNFYLINAYGLITDSLGGQYKFLTTVFTADANTENGDINQNTDENLAVYIKDLVAHPMDNTIKTTVLVNIEDIERFASQLFLPVEQIDLVVQVYSVNEDLYKYAFSYEKLQQAGEHIGGLLGIPGTVNVHSNIENGIGIFGCYQLDVLTYQL